ncbi:MAG: hypothetical protein PHC59_02380 [Thomasclavelia ramosa]|uniref:hypothetical protein n=2 Tax=Thomasclavelia ramosa TaxID=1547 RepID=UPI0011C237E4|nr:hypothetical protein [Thomasclavelia ramosa]MDD8034981.1 hypothetical protein [Thomasclavelia ramosa]
MTMYDKEYYRTVLNSMKPFIKLNYFSKELGLYQSNLSRFLKDSAYDDVMNIENLDLLYRTIVDTVSNYSSL